MPYALPKRAASTAQDKIFLVNIPPQIKAKLPPELTKYAIEVNQQNFANTVRESLLVRTQALLESYKNEARRLVITRVLHCAALCMGVPVVLIADDFSEQKTRFSVLDGILRVWDKSDISRIDFAPKSPKPLKDAMLMNLRLSINQAKGENIDICTLLNVYRGV